jgi:DnaJ-class molecular chaperone
MSIASRFIAWHWRRQKMAGGKQSSLQEGEFFTDERGDADLLGIYAAVITMLRWKRHMSIAVKKVRQDPNGDVFYRCEIEKTTAKKGGTIQVVLEHTTLSVVLKRGFVQEGTRFRMQGAGEKPIGHGPPGDVYLEFSIGNE